MDQMPLALTFAKTATPTPPSKTFVASASPTAVSPVRLSRLPLAHVLPPCRRLEGNSHCLRDSWGLPPPSSPHAPSAAGGPGCSPSRPAWGTVTTAAASSSLMPPGSSWPAAGWPPFCRGQPGNARRLRLPW